jgi:hypothetical protein
MVCFRYIIVYTLHISENTYNYYYYYYKYIQTSSVLTDALTLTPKSCTARVFGRTATTHGPISTAPWLTLVNPRRQPRFHLRQCLASSAELS